MLDIRHNERAIPRLKADIVWLRNPATPQGLVREPTCVLNQTRERELATIATLDDVDWMRGKGCVLLVQNCVICLDGKIRHHPDALQRPTATHTRPSTSILISIGLSAAILSHSRSSKNNHGTFSALMNTHQCPPRDAFISQGGRKSPKIGRAHV